MPLTLVLGPANAAKAGHVLGEFAAAARRDALLVVPTTLDAEHYMRELAGEGALLGTVTTFAGLVREIAARAGYEAAAISPLARGRALRRALAGLRLEALADSSGGRGFSVAAAALIDELTRSLITPQRFAQALARWALEDERRAAYARELSAIPLAYARELERLGRVDGELFAWRALDALRADPGRWGSTPVFFYGFDDLTAIERDAVETLSRISAREVMVSLTYEEGRPALSARAEVVGELRALAGRVLTLPALQEFYAERSRPVLHHLERSLFEPCPAEVPAGEAVVLLEAGGELAEAEMLGAEVLALLGQGFACTEIAVALRSPGRGGALLREVFASLGIPTAGEPPLQFVHTALGRAVRGLLRCALSPGGPARAEDLLDLLRLPGMASADRVDTLEAGLRRTGLTSAAAAAERWPGGVEAIARLQGAADPALTLCALARELLAAGWQGRAPVLDEDGQRDARALAALILALEEARELREALGACELAELIDELVVPGPGRETSTGVLISEPAAIRARRFRAVLVAGLVEGEFPAPARGEPFLSDEVRFELALASGLRLGAHENTLPRERYLLYASLSRATERVLLSYRSSDEEGNLLLRSPFVDDVAECLDPGWSERRRRRLLADVVWSVAEAPTDRERARSQAAATGASLTRLVPVAGTLGEAAQIHLRHRQMVSAGAIEKYADCPMSWLVERQLEPLSMAPEPEAMARGNLAHSVLEAVFRDLGGPLSPDNLDEAIRRLDRALDRGGETYARERSRTVRGALRGSLRADLRRYLTQEAADSCAFVPDRVELRFGFDERDSLPPVVLRGGPDPVLMRGAVDRIDLDPASRGAAIVRDYKSGVRRPEHAVARWPADRRIQVAMYMIAVRQLLDLDPVAGFYQPLRGQDLRPRGVFISDEAVGERPVATDSVSTEELEAALSQAQVRAVAIADEIRAGKVPARPSTCSREGCRYPGICRV